MPESYFRTSKSSTEILQRCGYYSALTVNGPFTVDSRITGVPLPYSMRRLSSSSNVLRAAPQTLAWQVIGECPADSKTKLVLSSDGTLNEIGPFTASATSPPLLQSELCSATLIGPFSVCSFSLPLLPEIEIGPFCEEMSASPVQFDIDTGPFTPRTWIFPSTSENETGPFCDSTSIFAARGVRTSNCTVQ